MKHKLKILQTEPLTALSKDVRKVKDILRISGRSHVVGSAQYKHIEYNNDVDLTETIKDIKDCSNY